MSERYPALYIKPDTGSHGIGIMKLERTEEGYKVYSLNNKSQTVKNFASLDDAYGELRRRSGRRRMLVQEAIVMDRVGGRPYDIRAMVQRRPRGKWTCTGHMVKVGKKNKIVTNYYQGGRIWPLKRLWAAKEYTEEQKQELNKQLETTALRIARRLSSEKKGMREMGIDLAYDETGKLWVIEVNSNHPQFHPLKKIDPSAYKWMMRFARSYGRRSAK